LSTERMIDILAVPGPPTRMTARFCEMERPILYSQRTESIVEMSSDANSLPIDQAAQLRPSRG